MPKPGEETSDRVISLAPAIQPTLTTLSGRLVSLTGLHAARHAPALYSGSHGADEDRRWHHLHEGPFPDLASFTTALDQKSRSAGRLYFAVIENASGDAVGHAAYLNITPLDRVIEVGAIMYTRRLQRTPGGTEAMYLMARHAFEALGYRRYEWKCNALNEPSRRAALRLGFTFEGVFRQHMIVKGRSRDTAWFSMLDSEWPRCRRALEAWLDPSNFDAAGRQRRSLAALRAALPDSSSA